MLKKIVAGTFFSLILTVVFWRLTGMLRLDNTGDNILFVASPIAAIALSVFLVRRFAGSVR